MRIASLADFAAQLSEFADCADREHERFTITRNGRPSFVVLAVDDFDGMEETIYWLTQPGVRDDMAAADRAEAADVGMDEAELRAMLKTTPRT